MDQNSPQRMRERSYAVISVGYNRPECQKRLLDSLCAADYGDDKVDLIISLDFSGDEAVKAVADDCVWTHGEKRVRQFTERQGLRNHILSCGDYTEQYDAVAVFEDDLFVSPGFFQYMKETVAYYGEDPMIGGISLFGYQWDIVTDRRFEPTKSEYDVYFMQIAQSWGQIWTRSEWRAFRLWYNDHRGQNLPEKKIPSCVREWPESSWLKYYIWYCVDQNKYFVYPYASLTTNFMETGEHGPQVAWRHQVPLQTGVLYHYRLCPVTENAVRYDVYFENQNLSSWLGFPDGSVCADLYGSRETVQGYQYWITPRQSDLPEESSFGLQMCPMEMNIRFGVAGDYFHLYRLKDGYEVSPPEPRKQKMFWVAYDIHGEGIRLGNALMWFKGCIAKGLREACSKIKRQ